jgi:hypothetical protein
MVSPNQQNCMGIEPNVKTPGYNVRGLNVCGHNVWGHNVRGRIVPVPRVLAKEHSIFTCPGITSFLVFLRTFYVWKKFVTMVKLHF